MRSLIPNRQLIFSLLLMALLTSSGAADTFTFINQDGDTESVEATLLGTGKDVHALELPDGRLRIVPQAAVTERDASAEPEPIDSDGMISLLEEEFGEDRVHSIAQEPYIASVVLTAPVAKAKEARVRAYLRTAARFLSNIDKIFSQYARLMRIPLEDPKFPLVLLIFENDQDFEKYAADVTGGRGLSAGRIAGFYSPQTNWLAVRMSECFTFEVPLHEAIHQQVYNRGVFQRLAPVPTWFNEGIATGFENDGEKIAVHPSKINTRYAKLAHRATNVSWADLIEDDSAFRGDVLAGEAYTHAWCLHWMLATGHTDEYRDYVAVLSQRRPLQELSKEERLERFEETFGKSVTELQQDFPRQLQLAARRQRIRVEDDDRPGYSITQSDSAEVKLEAINRVDQGGILNVRGTVKNRSPFRDLMLYVTVETESGTYADWLLPVVRSGQTASLRPSTATKVMPGASGGPSRTYRVHVQSAIPGSDEAKNWLSGQVPGPVGSRGL